MTQSPDRRRLAVIGNPNSAGSYAAGQDLAPQVLRAAGLMHSMAHAGRTVTDLGDLAHWPWRPDLRQRSAQNLPDVLSNLLELQARILPALRDGDDVLVIGGNCTAALAAVAAVRDSTGQLPALLYIDRHLDANTPRSVTDGALDWMGIAHALALPDTIDELVAAFGTPPLLTASQLVYLGVDEQCCTEWELNQIDRLGIRRYSSDALARDPALTTTAALADLPDGPLVINLDVDVLDFTDAPLAEDTAGRNTGPSLEQLHTALAAAMRDGRSRVLCVSELNPTRSVADPTVLQRFIDMLVAVFN